MFELAQKFINKECVIYTFNSQFTGTIKEVNEGGILIEKSGTLEAVNFDFIVRIREYPKNKNGKKKSVILDKTQPPSDEGGGFCEAKDGGRERLPLSQLR